MPIRAHRPQHLAFTLIEILIVVVVLGIAGALVIPSMGQTGVLRVQAAVRTIISDITFAQSDAVAFQERRAVVFDVENQTYALARVPGDVIDVDTDIMYDPTQPDGRYVVNLADPRFGGIQLESADFDGGNALIFDAMGGPVADAAGDTAGTGGVIRISGSVQTFDIRVDAFTGRVSVDLVERSPAGLGGTGIVSEDEPAQNGLQGGTQ